MKYHQFIVVGASTAGKSTFSHELIKKYYVQHICIDPILDAFQTVFPELGITHMAFTHEDHEAVCQRFKPFVSKMVQELDHDDFVIEGFRLPLEDLHTQFPHLQYLAFGFPDATPEERVAACRKYDETNWTNELDDAELTKTMKFLIDESKHLKETCARIGVPFFDTTGDYAGTLQKALTLTR